MNHRITKLCLITLAACAPEMPEPPAGSLDDRFVGTFEGPDGPVTANYRLVEGDAIVGGDMLMDFATSPGFRSAAYPTARWAGGRIPYELPADFPGRNVVLGGISKWNAYTSQTGVRFVPRTNETNYVAFQNSSPGCFAAVGSRGGRQPVNLGPNCVTDDTVVHELGHAIGLMHEHQRSDRDQHITVHYDNLQPSFRADLDIMQGGTRLGGYDFDSIMHYSNGGSAAIDPNKPIMSAANGDSLLSYRLWSRNLTLSAGDVQGVATMYRGVGNTSTSTSTTGTTTGTTTTSASCGAPCAQFDVAEGACRSYSTGSFSCSSGCMRQVARCDQTTTTTPTAGSCAFLCADYGFSNGQCSRGNNGQAWQCNGACLEQVASCSGAVATCDYACADYNYVEGQCAVTGGGQAWRCRGGCLESASSCSTATTTTTTTTASCDVSCSQFGMSEGQCKSFSTGQWSCISGCMKPGCS